MNEADRKKLWDELGVVCDCCGRAIGEDSRPFIIPSLANAGYTHSLCSVCVDGMTLAEVGRFTARVADRSLPEVGRIVQVIDEVRGGVRHQRVLDSAGVIWMRSAESCPVEYAPGVRVEVVPFAWRPWVRDGDVLPLPPGGAS